MADRFFLVSSDYTKPLIELVGAGSADEFRDLVQRAGSDRTLSSRLWAVVVDNGTPGDVESVPLSDINFMLAKVLMRRLLLHIRPYKFDAHNDSEHLLNYLRQAWGIQR